MIDSCTCTMSDGQGVGDIGAIAPVREESDLKHDQNAFFNRYTIW